MDTASFLGWLFLSAGALLCTYLSSLIEIEGKHPLDAAALAVVLGIFIRNRFGIAPYLKAGVNSFEKPLILGIVFLGASFDPSLFSTQGSAVFLVVLGTMIFGLISIFFLSRRFKLSPQLSLLLSVGTTICGGTAIAVIAPLIKAKQEETSYAIGVIALFGLAAIFVYPIAAQYLGVSDFAFGVFAGTAVHSTPQVIAAGFIFSDPAGNTATAVKLVRNCFLAPTALGISFFWNKRTASGRRANVEFMKAFPWFLFGYFVVAGLVMGGFIPAEESAFLILAGKFLVLMGLFGVGLNSDFAALRLVGPRPMIVGFLASIAVAAMSAFLVWKLLI